jgi:hypothetical protein
MLDLVVWVDLNSTPFKEMQLSEPWYFAWIQFQIIFKNGSKRSARRIELFGHFALPLLFRLKRSLTF